MKARSVLIFTIVCVGLSPAASQAEQQKCTQFLNTELVRYGFTDQEGRAKSGIKHFREVGGDDTYWSRERETYLSLTPRNEIVIDHPDVTVSGCARDKRRLRIPLSSACEASNIVYGNREESETLTVDADVCSRVATLTQEKRAKIRKCDGDYIAVALCNKYFMIKPNMRSVGSQTAPRAVPAQD